MLPANLNFACLLWEYPKRKFYTEAERKPCKMFCTVGCGGQQTQKRDGREQLLEKGTFLVLETSCSCCSFQVRGRVCSLMCEVLRDASMLCHCMPCEGYLRQWQIKKASCIPAMASVSAQFMHCLQFPYGTANRNCPEWYFSRWVKRKGPATKQISLNIANNSQKLNVRKYVNLFSVGFLCFHAALLQKVQLRNPRGRACNACFRYVKLNYLCSIVSYAAACIGKTWESTS